MARNAANPPVALLLKPRRSEIVDVMGPTIEFLTHPDEGDPCIMRGTILPGVIVPLHSHADPETFLPTAGEVEGLTQTADGYRWIRIGQGDIFHVPGGARHAFRNRTQEPAVMIVISTARLGRFFREAGVPMAVDAPLPDSRSPEAIRHVLETAGRYGYWTASPEENAQVGLRLPGL